MESMKSEKFSRIWKDPVWSKVIAAFLLAVFTLLYNLAKSYYDNTDFVTEFHQLWQTKISLWIFVLFSILIYITSYNVYRAKPKPKFVYDSETIELDRKLFNKIRTELITRETLDDLFNHTFSNHSFERAKFDFIHHTITASENPEFEFLNPELEDAKNKLIDAIKKLQVASFGTIYSAPTHNEIGYLGIPREWDQKRFYEAVDKIDPEETNVFQRAESLIKLGRRILKI
jgi:uncharacterized protein with PQ loop repeat